MNRTYEGITTDEVISFFFGIEIENTRFVGYRTLFVTGIQDLDTIKSQARKYDADHIYLGANHSYSGEVDEYNKLISSLFSWEYVVTLDLDYRYFEEYRNSTPKNILDSNYFCLNVGVKMNNAFDIKNLCIKVDDSTFDYSNPGVSVFRVDRNDTESFTPWCKYKEDIICE